MLEEWRTTRSALSAAAMIMILLPSLALRSQEAGRASKIADAKIGDVFEMWSKQLNEKRIYSVSLPSSYNQSKAEYPLVVVLDGENYFAPAVGVCRFMSMNRLMPEAVVVGIHNSDRRKDMTPPDVTLPDVGKGNGAAFLAFLEEELLPVLKSSYRLLPLRILVGHSHGRADRILCDIGAAESLPMVPARRCARHPRQWGFREKIGELSWSAPRPDGEDDLDRAIHGLDGRLLAGFGNKGPEVIRPHARQDAGGNARDDVPKAVIQSHSPNKVEITFEVQDGKAVARHREFNESGTEVTPILGNIAYLRMRGKDTIEWGYMNGMRPRTMIIAYKAGLDASGALVGFSSPTAVSFSPERRDDPEKRQPFKFIRQE